MFERLKKKSLAVTKALKQFQEDWLPLDEAYWPTYAGSRRWYPGIREEEARQRVRKAQKKERDRFAYLKRKKWIEMKRTAEGLLVRLTDQGRMERLRRTLHEKPLLKGSRVCLVMFDVPESVRHSRDAFRHFLKTAGFTLVQRSVWMSNRDVASDVMQFIRQAKIVDWVSVFVGEMET
ncbi:MAG: Repressor in the phenylacetic acid catabolism [Candidatus Uhrbacteria bacterium GW2011_GWA2_52_8d]|uniref:Repressor in the phenylacetic acid catabolism n=1 Tax=Candidatus Uhrbacteria bacterium GW2011_GWA2_52_8d TaxID=1618979 RepID=A0A0G1ZU06_9BACT|nr:MAG: Repressor in the phenylacetic acid catabolism [Candidatus Uhrbacteria bacterium GW2011_GWA2_52_8d]